MKKIRTMSLIIGVLSIGIIYFSLLDKDVTVNLNKPIIIDKPLFYINKNIGKNYIFLVNYINKKTISYTIVKYDKKSFNFLYKIPHNKCFYDLNKIDNYYFFKIIKYPYKIEGHEITKDRIKLFIKQVCDIS